MSNFCQQGDITKIFIVDTGNSGTTGTDIYVTGGTYSNGTLTLGRNDGVSLLISGFLTGTTDTFITGGTYSEGVLILNRNDGVNISISGFSTTAIFTGNTSANCITDLYISNLHGCSPITVWDPINSLSSISATTYYGDGSNLTGIPDYYVTGSTYSNGTLTLNRQNGSVSVSGFLTGTTDTFTTGFTYSNNNLTINRNQGLTPLTVSINNFTGLTINGSLSASTYLGLPIDPDNFVTGGTFSSGTLTLNRQNGSVTITGITDNFVTGGTYSNGTLTLNRQNGSLTVTGFLTGTTTDTFVTGFTFSSNTLTISQNQGQVPLTASITTIDLSNIFSAVTFNIGTTGSISATTFFGNGSGLTGIPDYYVTGGTFSSGTLTLNRQNGSVTVTGITDNFVTGGTYSNGTLTLNRQNGLVTITGFLTGTTDTDNFVTGGTYSNGTLTLNRQNGSLTVTGFLTGTTTDTYVTGFTYNGINQLTISQNVGQPNLNVVVDNLTLTGLTVNGSISATTYYGNGQFLTNIPDNFVTGGTYSSGTGTLTLNRQNGSVTISGFSTGGGSLSGDTYVTGFTYNNANRLTISQNGGQSDLIVFINTFSGLTVNGSVSATTFFGNGSGLTGVPDNFVTGGTFNTSNRVLTLNRQNGTFNVSGITDTFVTGFTYSNNNLTINQSQGQTPLTVNISVMTGLTVNGSLTATTLTVTSTSNLNGTINSTNLSGSGDRVVQVNSSGTFSATNQIISAYLTSGGTVANILENTNNWDINGVFIGSGITGTYQGQKHYNNNYFFEAVADNLFIRLIRG
jgi:hypothetical protein